MKTFPISSSAKSSILGVPAALKLKNLQTSDRNVKTAGNSPNLVILNGSGQGASGYDKHVFAYIYSLRGFKEGIPNESSTMPINPMISWVEIMAEFDVGIISCLATESIRDTQEISNIIYILTANSCASVFDLQERFAISPRILYDGSSIRRFIDSIRSFGDGHEFFIRKLHVCANSSPRQDTRHVAVTRSTT
jgi:hypothetical protein